MKRSQIAFSLVAVLKALFLSTIVTISAHAAESEVRVLKTIKGFGLKNINSLVVVSFTEETDLKTTVFSTPKYQKAYTESAAYTGGGATTMLATGLIGAARDADERARRQKAVDQAVAPTRKAIEDSKVDFIALFNQELEAAMADVDLAADVKNYAYVSETFKKNKFYKEKGKTADIIVIVEPQYRYSSHLHQLIFSAKVKAYKTLQLMEKQREYSVGERKALKSKYRALSHSPFYRSNVAYLSDTVEPMDLSFRPLTEEELEVRKVELTTYYDEQIANAKRKDKIGLKRKKKNHLRLIKQEKTFVDGPNIKGKLWLDSDAKLLKETIQLASKELAKLVVLDLNGVQVDKDKQDEHSRRLVAYKPFRGKANRNLHSVPGIKAE